MQGLNKFLLGNTPLLLAAGSGVGDGAYDRESDHVDPTSTTTHRQNTSQASIAQGKMKPGQADGSLAPTKTDVGTLIQLAAWMDKLMAWHAQMPHPLLDENQIAAWAIWTIQKVNHLIKLDREKQSRA